MKVLIARSTLISNGPSTQSLQIAKSLRSNGIESIFVSSGGSFVKTIEESGFKVITINGLSHKDHKLFKVIKTIFKLRKIIAANRPDLIHGHNAAATMLCFIGGLCSLRYLPCCTSVHGIELRKTHFYRNFIWLIVPGKLFAVCQHVKEKLLKFGVDKKKILVTYNGIDTNKFKFSSRLRKQIRVNLNLEGSIVIGTVGKTIRNPDIEGVTKGQHILIKAHAKLLKKFPNIKLLIIGDGNGLNYLKDLADKLGTSKSINFLGNRADVSDLLNAMDIFCLSSVYGELFPCAILEAMSSELPWVGSNISGFNELTMNGEVGLISSIGNIDTLVCNIEKLCLSKSLRKNKGKKAREFVLKNFTIEKVLEKILNTYNKLV